MGTSVTSNIIFQLFSFICHCSWGGKATQIIGSNRVNPPSQDSIHHPDHHIISSSGFRNHPKCMKNQQKNTKNYSYVFVLKSPHFGNLYLKSDMMAYKNINDSMKETPLRDSAEFSTQKKENTQKTLHH